MALLIQFKMNFIEKFSKSHTLIFSIVLALAFVVIFGFGFIIYPLLSILPSEFYNLPAADYLLNSFNNIIAFILLLCIVRAIGLSDNIPWNIKGAYKGILLGVIFIIFSLVQTYLLYSNAADKSIVVNVSGVIFGLIYCLTIALWEELLCRGIILTSILKKWHDRDKGVIKSVIVSSLIFGCAHIITAVNTSLSSSLMQVCYASVMGMLIGVIYIKTRSLGSAIVLHFILNIPAYILPYIMPYVGGMYDYEFIQLIVLFSAIWLFLTYFVVQRITDDDINHFIQ